MDHRKSDLWNRREFVGGLTVADTAGLLSIRAGLAAAEPPPDTTTLRTAHSQTMCEAPQSLAEELLRAEGFTSVQYVPTKDIDGEFAADKIDTAVRYSTARPRCSGKNRPPLSKYPSAKDSQLETVQDRQTADAHTFHRLDGDCKRVSTKRDRIILPTLVRSILHPKYGAWRRFDEFLTLNIAGMIAWRAGRSPAVQ